MSLFVDATWFKYLHLTGSRFREIFSVNLESVVCFTAWPCTQEHFSCLFSFLQKTPHITTIKILFRKTEAFDRPMQIDLSPFVHIRRLKLHGFFVCSALPSCLEHLESELCNLLQPFCLPSSVKTFVDLTPQFPVDEWSVAEVSDMDLLVKNNPQLVSISFSPFLGIIPNSEEKMQKFLEAISLRATPLDYLCVESHFTIRTEWQLQILLTKTKHVKARIHKDLFPIAPVDGMVLQKLTYTGEEPFENWTGWTQQLTDIETDFNRADSHERLHFYNVLVSHKKLRRFSIGENHMNVRHFQKILNHAHLLPANIIFEMDTSCYLFQTFFDMCKETEDIVCWSHKTSLSTFYFRKNISWLPHRHIDFPTEAHETLSTLALGLTRLKKFSHLLVLEKDPLVHVDPACIEWMLENFSLQDMS